MLRVAFSFVSLMQDRPMSSNYLWSIPAAITIIILETSYSMGGTWGALGWFYAPMAVLSSWFLFKVFNGAPSIIEATIVFTLVIQSLRTASALLVLKQNVSPGAWLGLGFVVAANISRALWR